MRDQEKYAGSGKICIPDQGGKKQPISELDPWPDRNFFV
jgi:hypothetical protein